MGEWCPFIFVCGIVILSKNVEELKWGAPVSFVCVIVLYKTINNASYITHMNQGKICNWRGWVPFHICFTRTPLNTLYTFSQITFWWTSARTDGRRGRTNGQTWRTNGLSWMSTDYSRLGCCHSQGNIVNSSISSHAIAAEGRVCFGLLHTSWKVVFVNSQIKWFLKSQEATRHT